MSIIVDFLVGLLFKLIGGIMALVNATVYNVLNVPAPTMSNLGAGLTATFFKTFRVMNLVFGVFKGLAVIVVLALVFHSLVKSMFGPLSKSAENPVIAALRGTVALWLIQFSKLLSGIFLYIGAAVYHVFKDLKPEGGTDWANFNFAENLTTADITVGLTADAATWFLGGSAIIGIITIFVIILILSSYLKLVVEIFERYVTMCFLALVSPLLVACIASNTTIQYFWSWLKMMISQTALLAFSTMFLNALQVAMVETNFQSGSFVGFAFLVVAFIVTGQKIDKHMATMGFTTAQGGDFGHAAFAAVTSTSRIAGAIARRGGTAGMQTGSAAARNAPTPRDKVSQNSGMGLFGSGGIIAGSRAGGGSGGTSGGGGAFSGRRGGGGGTGMSSSDRTSLNNLSRGKSFTKPGTLRSVTDGNSAKMVQFGAAGSRHSAGIMTGYQTDEKGGILVQDDKNNIARIANTENMNLDGVGVQNGNGTVIQGKGGAIQSASGMIEADGFDVEGKAANIPDDHFAAQEYTNSIAGTEMNGLERGNIEFAGEQNMFSVDSDGNIGDIATVNMDSFDGNGHLRTFDEAGIETAGGDYFKDANNQLHSIDDYGFRDDGASNYISSVHGSGGVIETESGLQELAGGSLVAREYDGNMQALTINEDGQAQWSNISPTAIDANGNITTSSHYDTIASPSEVEPHLDTNSLSGRTIGDYANAEGLSYDYGFEHNGNQYAFADGSIDDRAGMYIADDRGNVQAVNLSTGETESISASSIDNAQAGRMNYTYMNSDVDRYGRINQSDVDGYSAVSEASLGAQYGQSRSVIMKDNSSDTSYAEHIGDYGQIRESHFGSENSGAGGSARVVTYRSAYDDSRVASIGNADDFVAQPQHYVNNFVSQVPEFKEKIAQDKDVVSVAYNKEQGTAIFGVDNGYNVQYYAAASSDLNENVKGGLTYGTTTGSKVNVFMIGDAENEKQAIRQFKAMNTFKNKQDKISQVLSRSANRGIELSKGKRASSKGVLGLLKRASRRLRNK